VNVSRFNTAMSRNGPMRASHYFGAVDQWKTKTLANLREVRLGMDETERAHKRFLSEARHYARHTASQVLGGFGASYATGHAIKSGAKAAAARNREEIREEIAGFSPEQLQDANRVADEVSRRFPSLSRTDVLEDLRKNTARLGTFDRAKEMALVYAKARIANALSRFTSTIETGMVPLVSRGGKFLNWLRGNDAPIEGKIPMPKGDPRRLPDGSILSMPTSDPRNQIPDFPDDIVPRPEIFR
jgi:hypothetical protein